jgi:hypothetical protein
VLTDGVEVQERTADLPGVVGQGQEASSFVLGMVTGWLVRWSVVIGSSPSE